MLSFVFPGQGSQKAGMGKEVAERYPEAKQAFEEADEALGFAISQLCFEGPDSKLQLTEHAQPAILTTSIATLRALQQQTGLEPEFVAGHSLGEYSALVCAGAMSLADAVRTVRMRGRFMQEAVPQGEGGMAAVMGMAPEAVEALCKDAAEGDVLCPANFNAPSQIVIAGTAAAVDRAVALAKERKGVAKKLKVSAPFHCPMMEPAAARLAEELKQVTISAPKMPVVCNVTAEPNSDAGQVSDLLVRQVTAPVRWADTVHKLKSLGVERVLEIGAGKTLTGLIRRIEKSLETVNIETPQNIEDQLWTTREDGARINRDGTKIIWPDGLTWDFYDPKAHGF